MLLHKHTQITLIWIQVSWTDAKKGAVSLLYLFMSRPGGPGFSHFHDPLWTLVSHFFTALTTCLPHLSSVVRSLHQSCVDTWDINGATRALLILKQWPLLSSLCVCILLSRSDLTCVFCVFGMEVHGFVLYCRGDSFSGHEWYKS